MVEAVLFSNVKTGGTDVWVTPDSFFRAAELIYGRCDVDVCASAENAKCKKYFSPAEDGLKQPWHSVARHNCSVKSTLLEYRTMDGESPRRTAARRIGDMPCACKDGHTLVASLRPQGGQHSLPPS